MKTKCVLKIVLFIAISAVMLTLGAVQSIAQENSISVSLSDEVIVLTTDSTSATLSVTTSDSAGVTWTSSDYLLAYYDENLGAVCITGITGYVTITATSISDPSISAICHVYILLTTSDASGTYFFKNSYSGRFLSPAVTSTNTIVQDNINGMRQQWIISPTDDGYYNIQNALTYSYLSATYTTSPPSLTTTSNPDAVLAKWKIMLYDGKVVIIPKRSGNNEYFLSVNYSNNVTGGTLILADISEYMNYSKKLTYSSWKNLSAADYDGIQQFWNSSSNKAYYYPNDIKTYPLYWETSDSLNSTYKSNFCQGYSSAENQWSNALDINISADSPSSETDIVIYGVTADQYFSLTGKTWPNESLGFTSYPTLVLKGYRINPNNNDIYYISEATGRTMVYVLANEVTAPLVHCVVHEMGHALGYQGHSDSLADIMGEAIFSNNPNTPTQLTEDDITHLASIYRAYR